MISRYALYDIASVSKRFQAPSGLPKGVKASHSITPTSDTPVIVSRDGVPTIERMKWGLIAKGAKDTSAVFRYKSYLVASEKIFSRHSHDTLIRTNRCLVPANGFFDLSTTGDKRAFYATTTSGELTAFAGIHSTWEDPRGTIYGTFAILTTEATPDMPRLSGRTPVVLAPEDEMGWLDPSITDASSIYTFLRPNESKLFKMYEVGPSAHSKKQHGSDLIQPLN